MTKRRWPRRLCWIVVSAILAYVCASAVAAVVVTSATLHLPRRPLPDQRFVRDAVDNLHADLRDVSIEAQDGAVLRAWYVVPQNANGAAVLLLHGMGDNRTGVAGYAKLFLAHGYRVLLPDSRAHGESGGAIATYGLLERDDIYRWTEWLKSQSTSGCIYGFGESMGAALIIQALATPAPLCAVVAESPFSTFREAAYDRASSYLKVGPSLGRAVSGLTIELSFMCARLRYGLDLANASPESALADSQVPVLLVHGARDTNIPPRHSRILHKTAASHSKLWIVPGAEHTGAWATDPLHFEQNVLGWFGAHQAFELGFRR
jgi:fermentation-respiration switch protein FrsA (DUF1100 family)